MPDPEIHNKNVLASVLETLELETLFSLFICQYKIPYKISNFPISDWFYSILCTPLYWLNFIHLTFYKLKIKIISIKPSDITRSTGSSKTCAVVYSLLSPSGFPTKDEPAKTKLN